MNLNTTLLTVVFILIIFSASAQSKSFQVLRQKFSENENTFSFTTSGFFAKTILWVAGEHEYIKAIKDVKNIRLIVIPKEAFRKQQVTLAGFMKFTKQDSFEELARVRDHGDDVRLLIQGEKTGKDNRYLILAESNDEIVAIEVKGDIDPNILLKNDRSLAYH